MANSEDQSVQTRRRRWFDGMSRLVLLSLSCCALLLMCRLTVLFDGVCNPIHFILFGAILFFAGCTNVSWPRKRDTYITSSRYLKSMDKGFQQIVKTVADNVKQDSNEPTSTYPESGVYNVDFKQTSISDNKTSTLLHGGLLNTSALTIQVTPDIESSNGGWLVQGSRKTNGKDFYVISQGFVAASGKAYWVETSSYQSLLVTGCFRGASFSDGEWLSSNGDRGRYTDFHRLNLVEADTAVMLNDDALAQQPESHDGAMVETPMLVVSNQIERNDEFIDYQPNIVVILFIQFTIEVVILLLNAC